MSRLSGTPRSADGRASVGRRELAVGRPQVNLAVQDSGETCVRGGWLAAASALGGDLEGRVHGGRFASAISPFFIDSSSLQRSRDAARSLLDDIEACLTMPGELIRETTLRLDKYLAAAKQLKLLLLQPDMECRDIYDRAKSLLHTAMASLATELCHLQIWRLDPLKDHLGISAASIWESVRGSCSSASTTDSGGSSGTSIGTGGSSNGASFAAYHLDLFEDVSVRSDDAASGMTFFDCKSLSILNNIACTMIESGYEDMLRRAIDRHSSRLSSYVEVLDMHNIFHGHMEESKEILLKVWISAMRIIVGFLSEIQRQLNGHALGYFNMIKDDYFLAIAKFSGQKLFNSATSICTQESPPIDSSGQYAAVKPDLSKLVNVVMMILALFSGQTKVSIIAKGEQFIHGLSDMFVKLWVEQNDLVRSQQFVITETGVHHYTKHVIDHIRLLVQHKGTIYQMLKGDMKAFGEVVTNLILSLEFMLDMNSRSMQLPGQQQLFLLNNLHFMLQEAKKNTDLRQIVGEGWLLQHHAQLDLFITRYVDASWTPVVSSFTRRTRVPEILWPRQLFDKFTSSFEMIYRVHKTWKIIDPLLRQKVRQAICHKVIPEYRMQIENYMEKKHKSARYNVEQLESLLQELFEG